MSAITGFKRLGLALLTLVAIVFGALAAVSFLVPADQVRDTVTAEIRAMTGLPPHIAGDTQVSLFPTGMASLSHVTLGEAGSVAPPLVAEKLIARLRFFPLLTGRIEISDIALVNPRITLIVSKDGSNWAPLIAALQRNFDPGKTKTAHAVSFSEILISDGTITIRDETRGIEEYLRDVNLSLAWPAISRSFAATGHLTWRHEPIEASLALSDFAAALSGKRTGLKARLAGAPVKAAFDGNMDLQPTLKIDGALSADSNSLRRLMLWTGLTPLPGGGFGKFSLKAQTSAMTGTVALSQVNLEIDGNAAEGVLTLTGDRRKILQGTLAADEIDLTPYLSTIQLLTESDREWSRAPLMLDGLAANEIDLRLSAGKMTIGSAQLKRTAIAANLRGGRLTATIGESQAFGGTIKGTLGLAASEQGADFKSQMQFTGVNLDKCIGELFGIRRLEGKGDLTLALDGSGRSVYALTRNLNGHATLTAAKGALAGLNVEQLLRRLERRPLSGGSEFRTGRTAFDNLDLNLKVVQGIANVDRMILEGPSLRLSLDGKASIPARDLNLSGIAALRGNGGTSEAFELPFAVHGQWDDPVMLPDPQILIRRSGAAAPLLDAARENKMREAVETAIKELGGKPAEPSTPAAIPLSTSRDAPDKRDATAKPIRE